MEETKIEMLKLVNIGDIENAKKLIESGVYPIVVTATPSDEDYNKYLQERYVSDGSAYLLEYAPSDNYSIIVGENNEFKRIKNTQPIDRSNDAIFTTEDGFEYQLSNEIETLHPSRTK